MTPQAGVLFDVDGTLVDTNYLHTVAWSRAFADLGAWAPMNAIHRLVGMGGDLLVERLLGHPDAEAEAARARHFKALAPEAQVLPGARELLRRVHDEGLVVVLASSAPADELQMMMDLLDVADAIDATTSADDVDEAKPAPAVFEAALAAGSVDRERALVLGDSIWDIRSARSAGIGCIAVETGGFSAHELREEGAVAIFRDAREVLAQIGTGPIGPLLTSARHRADGGR